MSLPWAFILQHFNVCDLTQVDYWKCSKCGFCASKTHFEMTDKEWESLNNTFHSESHFTEDNPYNRNQRYFNQSLMLSLMTKQNLIKNGKWVDWGCGIGRCRKRGDISTPRWRSPGQFRFARRFQAAGDKLSQLRQGLIGAKRRCDARPKSSCPGGVNPEVLGLTLAGYERLGKI